MIKHALGRMVQKSGMIVSRVLFTENVLASDLGKRLYLLLYLAYKHLFEGDELKESGQYIRPGSTVLDIGANVGFTSEFYSRAVGSTGSVIAFEPDPIAAEIFKYNAARWGTHRVRLVGVALGDRDGDAVFFQNPSNRADNRLSADPVMAPKAVQVTVPMRTLSSVAAQEPETFAHVSFIKIDVQGYETQTIAGMADWMARLHQKPTLLVELWPYGLRKAGTHIGQLLDAIERLGYAVAPELRAAMGKLDGPDDYRNAVFIPTPSA